MQSCSNLFQDKSVKISQIKKKIGGSEAEDGDQAPVTSHRTQRLNLEDNFLNFNFAPKNTLSIEGMIDPMS